MTINKTKPPAASVLEACERAMCASLHLANEARAAGDTRREAEHLARLAWWTERATEYMKEGVQ